MRKWTSLVAAGLVAVAFAACGGSKSERPAAGPAVTLEQFGKDVEQVKGLVLVDFWAPWCGPCRQMMPVFERVEPSYTGRVKFVKVNVDQAGDVAQKYEVSSIPNFVLFKDGKPVDRKVGGMPEATLRAWLDEQVKAAGG